MILEGTGKKGSREEGGTQRTLVLQGGMKEGRVCEGDHGEIWGRR